MYMNDGNMGLLAPLGTFWSKQFASTLIPKSTAPVPKLDLGTSAITAAAQGLPTPLPTAAPRFDLGTQTIKPLQFDLGVPAPYVPPTVTAPIAPVISAPSAPIKAGLGQFAVPIAGAGILLIILLTSQKKKVAKGRSTR